MGGRAVSCMHRTATSCCTSTSLVNTQRNALFRALSTPNMNPISCLKITDSILIQALRPATLECAGDLDGVLGGGDGVGVGLV